MVSDPLCLSSELQAINPVLYDHLNQLDLQADSHQGQQISDHCLDTEDFATLTKLGIVSDSSIDTYRKQFHYFEEIRAQIPKVRLHLAGVNPKNFEAVVDRFLELYRTGKITAEELPLLVQAYFHAFHRYKIFEAPRSADRAVASGVFDCNELAEGVQIILQRAGIETKAVVFSNTRQSKHAFTAFKINGKWGYASVSSFRKPELASFGEILDLWESHRFADAFLVGKFREGRLTEVSLHPPVPKDD